MSVFVLFLCIIYVWKAFTLANIWLLGLFQYVPQVHRKKKKNFFYI